MPLLIVTKFCVGVRRGSRLLVTMQERRTHAEAAGMRWCVFPRRSCDCTDVP